MAVTASVVSGGLSAAELVLTNGDRIHGTLTSVNASSVMWKSDSFGDLAIDKSKVANLTTDHKMKIQGVKEACIINGMEGYYLNYVCGDNNEPHSMQLMALDSIVPFVQFHADGAQMSGKMKLAATYQRGNTVEDDVAIDGETAYREGDWRHVGSLNYDSESTDNLPADEDYDLDYRLDRFFSERWFWYNQIGYGAEESINVDERYTFGTGIGVQLWEDPNSALAIGNGLLYKKELLDPTAEEKVDPSWNSKTEVAYYRFSTKFRYKLPFSAEIFNTNVVLYSLQDSENWELSADFGLHIPLGVGLFSEFKLEYDYDNQPSSPDARNEDSKLTVGIGYQW